MPEIEHRVGRRLHIASVFSFKQDALMPDFTCFDFHATLVHNLQVLSTFVASSSLSPIHRRVLKSAAVMLSQFQASYQRVEASLQKLTDSIAAYNPSITAADELVAADDAVQINREQRMDNHFHFYRELSSQ